MKKSLAISVLALAAVMGMAAVASAQSSGLYFAPKIGYSQQNATLNAVIHDSDEDEWVDAGAGSQKKSKGGMVLGLAVGYDLMPALDVPVRAELEYAWRGKREMRNLTESDPDYPGEDMYEKAKIGVQSLFLNGYFDIHNSSPVTPYIGAGLGFARVSAEYKIGVENVGDVVDISKTKTNFAWNIGAGAAFKVVENVSLDLGYRYAHFGKVDASLTNELLEDLGYDELAFKASKISAHEVMLGLRYTF